jgi:HlyD family secretion protein
VFRVRQIAGLAGIASVLVAITFGLANLRSRPSADFDGPWSSTVTIGKILWDVRGTGTLVRVGPAGKLIAIIAVPDASAGDLRLNQTAEVNTQDTFVNGHVNWINPSPSGGLRSVDIMLDSALPAGASANQKVEANIHLGKLDDILYVGRPIHANQDSLISVFKLVAEYKQAVRTTVKFGRASVNIIEILGGLKEGDKILLSDMSAHDNSNVVRIR